MNNDQNLTDNTLVRFLKAKKYFLVYKNSFNVD